MKRFFFFVWLILLTIVLTTCQRDQATTKVDDIIQIHDEVLDDLNTQCQNGTDVETALYNCIERLASNPKVEEAYLQDNQIVINYPSGVTSVVLFLPDEESSPNNEKKFSIEKNHSNASVKSISKSDDNPNIIKNHNVLVWCPFYADEDENGNVIEATKKTKDWMYSFFDNYINNAPEIDDLSVKFIMGSSCDVASLKNISSYGYVVLETHGCSYKNIFGRKYISLLTGEIVSPKGKLSVDQDKIIVRKVKYTKKVLFVNDLNNTQVEFRSDGDYYAITNNYFSNFVKDKFDKASVVMVIACQGMRNPALSNAFVKDLGAGAFLGYNDNVSMQFGTDNAIAITKSMFLNKKNVYDAYQSLSETTDPYYNGSIEVVYFHWLPVFIPHHPAKFLYAGIKDSSAPTYFGLNNYITCTEMNKTWNLKEMQYSTGVVTNSWNYLNGKHYRRLVFKGDTINIGTIRLSYNADGSISPGTFSAFNVTNEESEISFETSNDPFIFMTGGWSNEPPRILTIKGPSLWYDIVEGSFTYDTLNSKKKFTFNFITNNGYHFIGQYVE